MFSFKSNIEVFLCTGCTDSLTISYTFWEQVKQSDHKLLTNYQENVKIETVIDNELADDREHCDASSSILSDDLRFIDAVHNDDGAMNYEFINLEELPSSDSDMRIEKNDVVVHQPAKKEQQSFKRKRPTRNQLKTIPKDKPIATTSGNYQNVALPHFVINNNSQSEDDDELEANMHFGDDIIDDTTRKQKFKTMSVSAFKLNADGESNSTDLQNLDKICAPSPSTDDGTSIFKCKYCPKAFATPYHLMIHTRKSHVCQHCLQGFDKPTDLYKHIKEKHNQFECLLCGRVFKSNSNLRQHMRKMHSIFLPAHVSLLNLEEKFDEKV